MLAACGGTGATEGPLQRVQFTAHEAPTTPTCQVGRRCERPFDGRIDVITADGHDTAITTDVHGHATLDIPTGSYRITTDDTHSLPRLTSAVVAGRRILAVDGRILLHVRAADTQSITLLFDTGIR
jgi:hypothetical protein